MKRVMIQVLLANSALADSTFRLGTARFGAAGTVVGDRLYVCGGSGWSGPLDTVEALDPVGGVATTLPLRVKDRWFHAAATWSNRIVLVGGLRAGREGVPGGRTAEVEWLDPVAGATGTLPPLARARSNPAAAVVGNRLYVVGGALSGDRTARTGDLEIYDFQSGTWMAGPPMPTPRECAVAVVGTRLYALGGFDGSNTLDTVEVFDTETGQWATRPPLAAPQSAHRAVADGTQVYLFGDYNTLVQVAAGDPESGTWRLLDLNYQPARHAAAGRVGDRLVVAGGNTDSGANSALNGIQVFTREHLQAAPTRPHPPAAMTRSTTPALTEGEQTLQAAQERMAGLTTLQLTGYWDFSCEVRGVPRNLRAPYRLVVRRPDHAFLELGSVRLWYNGAQLTLAESTRNLFLQLPENSPTSRVLTTHGYPILDLLPLGHQALLDPAQGLAVRMEGRRFAREGDGTWKGRPTWTLTTRPGAARSFTRWWVDQKTGITLEGVGQPDLGRETGDDCQTAEQDLVASFHHHLVIEEIRVDEPVPDEIFQPEPGFASNRVNNAFELCPASTRPTHALSWLRSFQNFSRTRQRPPERPAEWNLQWSTRLCGEQPSPDFDRYTLVRISPAFTVSLNAIQAVVLDVSDGSEHQLIPRPPATRLAEESMYQAAWVRGETPAEDRLVLHLQCRGEETGVRNQLQFLDRQGTLTHVFTNELAEVRQLRVAPRGGTRRDMLVALQGQTVRLLDPVTGETLRVLYLSGEHLEISDRDGDRLPEFTFIGRDASCYEWPDGE